MQRKIRVAAVSYLNTKPLIYGFEMGMMANEIELITDYPAKIATMLVNDEVDIALVPVATIPLLKEYHILTNYCIGATENVASVCLFSDVPIEEIKTILLDYQSRSSVGLLKILLKDFYKINPKIVAATSNYEQNIKGTTAGLVIGDRAFLQRKVNTFIYDLAGAWLQMTKLPFVFAAWISNKKLPHSFIRNFNIATAEGFLHLQKIIELNPYPHYDLYTYYTKNISFIFTDDKRKGLDEYLKKLKDL